MGQVFAGRYEFVDLLGDGGMGTVWRVWDHRERQYRAAKVLKQSDSASLLRFVRETSWRIDHDHVVTPIGWSAEDDRVLFTMPLVSGGTVATLARDFGRLPGIWVGDLIGQLLAALSAVHAAGLVHRDVKPSNLLLDATGRARPRLRLTDFGIAASIDEPRMTRVGEVIGTPGYQAPEAARGADPDPRQDLYAVGVVALELLTGARPPSAGVQRVDTGGIRQSSLAALVDRLLDPDPTRRPGSAEEALAALRATSPTASDRRGGEDIEVFDQLPPLPPGWSPGGPVPADRPGATERPAGHPTAPAAVSPAAASPTTGVAAAVTPVGSVTPVAGPVRSLGRSRAGLLLPAAAIAFGIVLIVIAVLLLT